MKTLMLKTVVAMCLLFCALLYGVNMVKDSMVQMNGRKALGTKTSVLDFSRSKRSLGGPEFAHSLGKNRMKSSRAEKKMTEYASIEERLDHLHAVDTFNPFSTLGDKLGKGVSMIFSGGMKVIADIVGGLVEPIL